jgi:aspartate/methionine/tyrosine aminotransferase
VTGFVPPAYPYDRLDEFRAMAEQLDGGAIDCSIGTPFDPPPQSVIDALGNSGSERSYPPSIGTLAFREAAAAWLKRQLDVSIDPVSEIGACIGTKEFVASTPNYLKLRSPERDTVLYPAVSYPSYAMGATLAGCRAVAVPVDDRWRIDLSAITPDDAARALCLWVNTPGNPAGGLDDLAAVAAWGRANNVLILSDECYVEFTWDGAGRTVLADGLDGVLAIHSLSKRSNLAGARAGFYAGDSTVVHYLREVRKHAGCMVPGPVQAAAIAAWSDQTHVDELRDTYRRRLEIGVELFAALDVPASMPGGGFYLWVAAPDGDAWALAATLAERAGVIVSPGEFYGEQSSGYVRLAVVQPTARLELARDRLR